MYVGGGSLLNLLALWRAHGLDEAMAEAWANGVVLSGVGAGAMCWFEHGVSRSHGGPRRMPAGHDLDDGVGLLFEETKPVRAVSAREGAGAYRLSARNGTLEEDPLDVDLLETPDEPGGRGEPVDELRELRLRRAVRKRARQRGARG